ASSITMLARGAALRASPVMQARLKEIKNISVLYNTQVDEIVGNDTVVTGVSVSNGVEGTTARLSADGVFIAIGHIPNTNLFKKWGMTDTEGYLTLGSRNQHTEVPGVFAAGDAADRTYKQAGVAAGDGIKAALDAYAFLRTCGYSSVVAREAQGGYYTPPADLCREGF
nr:FAD-dependent oxidoreductase [Candidatus Dependentiae bacterium]